MKARISIIFLFLFLFALFSLTVSAQTPPFDRDLRDRAYQCDPAASGVPRPSSITTVVLHHTGFSSSGLLPVSHLNADGSPLTTSAHFAINREGQIQYLCDIEGIANHIKGSDNLTDACSGTFEHQTRFSELDILEQRSIGIEIENAVTPFDSYTEAQYASLNRLLTYFAANLSNFAIDDAHVKAHYELEPTAGYYPSCTGQDARGFLLSSRKYDPSPAFDWSKIGLPNHNRFENIFPRSICESSIGGTVCDLLYGVPLDFPVVGTQANGQGKIVTSCFGYRDSLKDIHDGLDFDLAVGDEIKAMAKGTVFRTCNESSESCGKFGNAIIVKHSENFYTAYNHLSEVSVAVGQSVTTSTRIGKGGVSGIIVGSNGNDGSHLDVKVYLSQDDIWEEDKAVNPICYFSEDKIAQMNFLGQSCQLPHYPMPDGITVECAAVHKRMQGSEFGGVEKALFQGGGSAAAASNLIELTSALYSGPPVNVKDERTIGGIFAGSRGTSQPNLVVLHHTGPDLGSITQATYEGTVENFKRNKTSSHFVIEDDGTINYLVDLGSKANHLDDTYETQEKSSVSIELVNNARKDKQYTAAQYASVNLLLGYLSARYPGIRVDNDHVKAHYELEPSSPSRKIRKWDPSPNFRWNAINLDDHPRLSDVISKTVCENEINFESTGWTCNDIFAPVVTNVTVPSRAPKIFRVDIQSNEFAMGLLSDEINFTATDLVSLLPANDPVISGDTVDFHLTLCEADGKFSEGCDRILMQDERFLRVQLNVETRSSNLWFYPLPANAGLHLTSRASSPLTAFEEATTGPVPAGVLSSMDQGRPDGIEVTYQEAGDALVLKELKIIGVRLAAFKQFLDARRGLLDSGFGIPAPDTATAVATVNTNVLSPIELIVNETELASILSTGTRLSLSESVRLKGVPKGALTAGATVPVRLIVNQDRTLSDATSNDTKLFDGFVAYMMLEAGAQNFAYAISDPSPKEVSTFEELEANLEQIANLDLIVTTQFSSLSSAILDLPTNNEPDAFDAPIVQFRLTRNGRAVSIHGLTLPKTEKLKHLALAVKQKKATRAARDAADAAAVQGTGAKPPEFEISYVRVSQPQIVQGQEIPISFSVINTNTELQRDLTVKFSAKKEDGFPVGEFGSSDIAFITPQAKFSGLKRIAPAPGTLGLGKFFVCATLFKGTEQVAEEKCSDETFEVVVQATAGVVQLTRIIAPESISRGNPFKIKFQLQNTTLQAAQNKEIEIKAGPVVLGKVTVTEIPANMDSFESQEFEIRADVSRATTVGSTFKLTAKLLPAGSEISQEIPVIAVDTISKTIVFIQTPDGTQYRLDEEINKRLAAGRQNKTDSGRKFNAKNVATAWRRAETSTDRFDKHIIRFGNDLKLAAPDFVQNSGVALISAIIMTESSFGRNPSFYGQTSGGGLIETDRLVSFFKRRGDSHGLMHIARFNFGDREFKPALCMTKFRQVSFLEKVIPADVLVTLNASGTSKQILDAKVEYLENAFDLSPDLSLTCPDDQLSNGTVSKVLSNHEKSIEKGKNILLAYLQQEPVTSGKGAYENCENTRGLVVGLENIGVTLKEVLAVSAYNWGPSGTDCSLKKQAKNGQPGEIVIKAVSGGGDLYPVGVLTWKVLFEEFLQSKNIAQTVVLAPGTVPVVSPVDPILDFDFDITAASGVHTLTWNPSELPASATHVDVLHCSIQPENLLDSSTCAVVEKPTSNIPANVGTVAISGSGQGSYYLLEAKNGAQEESDLVATTVWNQAHDAVRQSFTLNITNPDVDGLFYNFAWDVDEVIQSGADTVTVLECSVVPSDLSGLFSCPSNKLSVVNSVSAHERKSNITYSSLADIPSAFLGLGVVQEGDDQIAVTQTQWLKTVDIPRGTAASGADSSCVVTLDTFSVDGLNLTIDNIERKINEEFELSLGTTISLGFATNCRTSDHFVNLVDLSSTAVYGDSLPVAPIAFSMVQKKDFDKPAGSFTYSYTFTETGKEDEFLAFLHAAREGDIGDEGLGIRIDVVPFGSARGVGLNKTIFKLNVKEKEACTLDFDELKVDGTTVRLDHANKKILDEIDLKVGTKLDIAFTPSCDVPKGYFISLDNLNEPIVGTGLKFFVLTSREERNRTPLTANAQKTVSLIVGEKEANAAVPPPLLLNTFLSDSTGNFALGIFMNGVSTEKLVYSFKRKSVAVGSGISSTCVPSTAEVCVFIPVGDGSGAKIDLANYVKSILNNDAATMQILRDKGYPVDEWTDAKLASHLKFGEEIIEAGQLLEDRTRGFTSPYFTNKGRDILAGLIAAENPEFDETKIKSGVASRYTGLTLRPVGSSSSPLPAKENLEKTAKRLAEVMNPSGMDRAQPRVFQAGCNNIKRNIAGIQDIIPGVTLAETLAVIQHKHIFLGDRKYNCKETAPGVITLEPALGITDSDFVAVVLALKSRYARLSDEQFKTGTVTLPPPPAAVAPKLNLTLKKNAVIDRAKLEWVFEGLVNLTPDDFAAVVYRCDRVDIAECAVKNPTPEHNQDYYPNATVLTQGVGLVPNPYIDSVNNTETHPQLQPHSKYLVVAYAPGHADELESGWIDLSTAVTAPEVEFAGESFFKYLKRFDEGSYRVEFVSAQEILGKPKANAKEIFDKFNTDGKKPLLVTNSQFFETDNSPSGLRVQNKVVAGKDITADKGSAIVYVTDNDSKLFIRKLDTTQTFSSWMASIPRLTNKVTDALQATLLYEDLGATYEGTLTDQIESNRTVLCESQFGLTVALFENKFLMPEATKTDGIQTVSEYLQANEICFGAAALDGGPTSQAYDGTNYVFETAVPVPYHMVVFEELEKYKIKPELKQLDDMPAGDKRAQLTWTVESSETDVDQLLFTVFRCEESDLASCETVGPLESPLIRNASSYHPNAIAESGISARRLFDPTDATNKRHRFIDRDDMPATIGSDAPDEKTLYQIVAFKSKPSRPDDGKVVAKTEWLAFKDALDSTTACAVKINDIKINGNDALFDPVTGFDPSFEAKLSQEPEFEVIYESTCAFSESYFTLETSADLFVLGKITHSPLGAKDTETSKKFTFKSLTTGSSNSASGPTTLGVFLQGYRGPITFYLELKDPDTTDYFKSETYDFKFLNEEAPADNILDATRGILDLIIDKVFQNKPITTAPVPAIDLEFHPIGVINNLLLHYVWDSKIPNYQYSVILCPDALPGKISDIFLDLVSDGTCVFAEDSSGSGTVTDPELRTVLVENTTAFLNQILIGEQFAKVIAIPTSTPLRPPIPRNYESDWQSFNFNLLEFTAKEDTTRGDSLAYAISDLFGSEDKFSFEYAGPNELQFNQFYMITFNNETTETKKFSIGRLVGPFPEISPGESSAVLIDTSESGLRLTTPFLPGTTYSLNITCVTGCQGEAGIFSKSLTTRFN